MIQTICMVDPNHPVQKLIKKNCTIKLAIINNKGNND